MPRSRLAVILITLVTMLSLCACRMFWQEQVARQEDGDSERMDETDWDFGSEGERDTLSEAGDFSEDETGDFEYPNAILIRW